MDSSSSASSLGTSLNSLPPDRVHAAPNAEDPRGAPDDAAEPAAATAPSGGTTVPVLPLEIIAMIAGHLPCVERFETTKGTRRNLAFACYDYYTLLLPNLYKRLCSRDLYCYVKGGQFSLPWSCRPPTTRLLPLGYSYVEDLTVGAHCDWLDTGSRDLLDCFLLVVCHNMKQLALVDPADAVCTFLVKHGGSQLPQLEKLAIDFGVQAFAEIGSSLPGNQLPQIKHLVIYDNGVDDFDLGALATFDGLLPKLETMSLDITGFDDVDGFGDFPERLAATMVHVDIVYTDELRELVQANPAFRPRHVRSNVGIYEAEPGPTSWLLGADFIERLTIARLDSVALLPRVPKSLKALAVEESLTVCCTERGKLETLKKSMARVKDVDANLCLPNHVSELSADELEVLAEEVEFWVSFSGVREGSRRKDLELAKIWEELADLIEQRAMEQDGDESDDCVE